MALSTAHLLGSPSLASQTTAAEEGGKLIYSKGESPSGSVLEAVLGEGSTTVPGTLMPCAGCHGAGGNGRAEGGVVPSEITWSALTRARETESPLAHRRPAYDLASLRRVMRQGVDPAGHELGVTMPRYKISDQDLDDLIAYLKQLGVKNDPGVTAAMVRAATVVPGKGPWSELEAGGAELMRAYFTELNQRGGIYGRKVELEVIAAGGTPAETALAVSEFVRDREVFALVGLFVPGAERQLADALENEGIPAIDVFPAEGPDRLLAKGKVFHVFSGLPAQARVLVRYAEERMAGPGSSVAIVYPERQRRLAETVIEECSARSYGSAKPHVYTRFDAEKTVAELSAAKPQGIFFLGQGPELDALLHATDRANWRPLIFQPGALAGEQAFRLSPESSERVFFSFPTLPSDIAPEAMAEYQFLVRKYKLQSTHTARAVATLAAVKIFVEGLRQTGRDLSREGFVDTLAALYNFNTGLTPPITFGATRRVGALGAHVVKLDTKTHTFAPAAPWMESAR